MLDLDDFKQVNDTYGHQIGDQMLREVARVLQDQLREYDFLARYAGDEFVAIVPELSEEQADDLRRRIELAVSRFSLRVRRDAHARVGISVGAARFGEDGESLSSLLIAADQAMYSVKSNHKLLRSRPPLPAEPVIEPQPDDLATTAIN
jgi:diguanylate cyclase (GGDEF)-like protein